MGFLDFVKNVVEDYQETKKKIEFENSPRGKALKEKQEKRIEDVTRFKKYLIVEIKKSYDKGDSNCNLNRLLGSTYNDYFSTQDLKKVSTDMKKEALGLALKELKFSEDQVKYGVLTF